MKTFREIREGSSAQSRLDKRAAKLGLGKKSDRLKKATDFFNKPPPSFSKAELKKMGYAVESNEDINVKSIDMFKTAAKDFDKKKTTKYDNFDSISDALSTIALQVRMLSKSTSGRTDVKAEKIISKQETRINNIINKTMYGKGGDTEEGREIKKILSKHGLDRTFNGLIFDSIVESADAQFDAWYKKSQELDKMQSDASAKLKKFPKGNMGLVPDSVKKDPKYRKIKSEADKIFKMIQHHNKSASKDMLRMARDRRRQEKK